MINFLNTHYPCGMTSSTGNIDFFKIYMLFVGVKEYSHYIKESSGRDAPHLRQLLSTLSSGWSNEIFP